MNSLIHHGFAEYMLGSRTHVGPLGFLGEEDVGSAFKKLRMQWADN